MHHVSSVSSLVLLSVAATLPAHAAILITGDYNLNGGTGAIEITEPITFTIKQSGYLGLLAFDE